MYITIQYPLFDTRLLSTDPNRTDRPDLGNPQDKDILRYIGQVIHAKPMVATGPSTKKVKKYYGSWDGTHKYFDASSILVLAGLGKGNYLKKLRNAGFGSKLLFRRFYSDSRFLARFEIAWTDNVEHSAAFTEAENKSIAFTDHIRQYLECNIKIKVGVKHKKELPVADAGSHLIYSYYWATTKEKEKSFRDKDVRYQVEYLSPYLMVQTWESAYISESGLEEIKIPVLNEKQIKLYFGRVPYTVNGKIQSIDAWIITSLQIKEYSPQYTKDFIKMSPGIQSLRQNILFIPSQIQALKKINACLQNPAFDTNLQEVPVQDKVAKYLHAVFTSLLKEQRNQLEQGRIIDYVFRNWSDAQSSNLKEEYQKSIEWFNFLPPTSFSQTIKAKLEDLKFKQKVYISSTFRDLKDYRKILIDLFEKQLRDKFELSYIMEKMFDDGKHELFENDCVKAVKDSDIYFIIMGNKVGSSPEKNSSRTYTEIEYDTAVQYNKQIHLLRLKQFDIKQMDNKVKHQELLNKFAGKPVNEFIDENDFKMKVLEILVQY